ncbi:TPA: hypothetical protein I8Y21_001156 [Klebsiella oxytoca]|uniref:Uncharacterized protein n=1 Tax=Klebsiella oxytoca TaxID=571 RepID=A0AAN5L6J6_KLEOX|nr:hypothetical protein [Klebsiella oxytoca]
MSNTSCPVISPPVQAWVTPEEAADIVSQNLSAAIKVSDIYRYALYGSLTLSIYFQSPIKLQRVTLSGGTIKLQKCKKSDLLYRLCFMSETSFINRDDRIIKTEGKFITPRYYIMDTPLMGHEMLKLQTLLADSLALPRPVTGQYDLHYGVLVKDEHAIYQVCECSTWAQRIEQQIQKIQTRHTLDLSPPLPPLMEKQGQACFPVHLFPRDACFVVTRTHLEQFIKASSPSRPSDSDRITTPLARMFWLACKHNDHISSLIENPYKLLPVFEKWAAEDGLTDRLSGDTLKRALKRGTPV